VTLLELEGQNFLSWYKFHLDLDKRGLVFINGLNGSGKTALFDAIEWCFFQKLSKKVPVDEVVRTGKKNCYVSVTFLDYQSDLYKVTRYRNHKEFGNRLIIYQGDEDITPATDPESNKLLSSIIRYGRPVFNNSLLYSTESEFCFTAMSDAPQKKVLRELIGLGILPLCQKIAQDKRSELDDKKHELAVKLDHTKLELKNLESLFENGDIDIESVARDRERHSKALDKLNARLDENASAYERHHEQHVLLSDKYTEFKRYAKSLSIACPICTKSIACPTCSKRVDERTYSRSLDAMEKRLARIQERVKRLTLEERDLLRKTESRIASIAECDKHLEQSETTTKLSTHCDQLRKRITKLRHQYKRYTRELSKYSFWADGFSKTGAELYGLNQALPILNRHIAKFLRVLLPSLVLTFDIDDKGKLSHTLSTDKGAYRISGLSTGQKQRVNLAVGLALNRTTQSFTGARSNVLMLDEAFEGLDEEGVNKAILLLRKLGKTIPSIFVISHHAELRAYFDQVIRIDLVNNTSRFVQ
jgi:DNA repair exonuclease SbcCD ATPase subunit